MHVTIAVPTFRRPDQLKALIPQLLEELNGFTGEILVIDNDPNQSAKSISLPARVRYISEPEPGLAAVRNRALGEAVDGLLAFIDDDELPHPNWLSTLVETWTNTGAAAVAGRVVPDYEIEVDPWLTAGQFFVRRCLPTGTVVPTAPAGNLLLDLTQIREIDLHFDPRFAFSGGEDTMFTTQLTAAKKKIVFCAESMVTDVVPAARMTRKWVLQRAFSHGNTAGFIDIINGGFSARLKLVIGGVARISVGIARLAWGWISRSLTHQAKGARLAARGSGLASAAFGFSYAEYARK